ncbi:MAG: glycosyltransferase family 2 protein [archaeon]
MAGTKAKEPTLSAYILTTDNEDTIKACLDSLKDVDEVLVIDGGSKDRTLDIARKYRNVNIYTNPWPGYPKQRNFALSKIRTDWVLYVDSDMEATPELIREIKQTIKNPKYKGYMVSYYNIFLDGYALEGGDWFPCYNDMLVSMEAKPHYDERRGVHEGDSFEGPFGRLQNFIIHHNYPKVEDWIAKMNQYTTLEVGRMEKLGVIFGRFKIRVNPRSFWSTMWFLLWYPKLFFMWAFFWRRGYRSGIPGLVYAMFGAIYIFLAHVKYWNHLCEKQGLKKPLKELVTYGHKIKSRYLKPEK